VGEAAATTPGKRSLAMEAFATALRAIPTTICDNAGARAAHGRVVRHHVRVVNHCFASCRVAVTSVSLRARGQLRHCTWPAGHKVKPHCKQRLRSQKCAACVVDGIPLGRFCLHSRQRTAVQADNMPTHARPGLRGADLAAARGARGRQRDRVGRGCHHRRRWRHGQAGHLRVLPGARAPGSCRCAHAGGAWPSLCSRACAHLAGRLPWPCHAEASAPCERRLCVMHRASLCLLAMQSDKAACACIELYCCLLAMQSEKACQHYLG